jgi:hypothetical protein
MPAPARTDVLELIALAISKSSLKDMLSADELRTRLDAGYDALTADGRLKLQVLWDQYSGQNGFDPKTAQCPMCWLKTLEPRLGMSVDLPAPLAGLKTTDVATQSAKVFVRREDVDKLLGPDTGPKARLSQELATPGPAGQPVTPVPSRPSTPLPARTTTPPAGIRSGAAAAIEPGAPPVDPGAPPEPGAPPIDPGAPARVARSTSGFKPPAERRALSPAHKRILAIASVVVSLASVAFLGASLRSGCSKPAVALDVRAAGPIPIKQGVRRGSEARLTLADPAWLGLPEADKRTQLTNALAALKPSGVESMVIVDGTGKTRASAQWVSGAPRVRLYDAR